MTLMDPKAAAETIRAAFEKDPPKREAEDRHTLTFLERVAEHLGVTPDAHTVSHIAHLLTHHDVQMHRPDEYPKMLTERGPKGSIVAKCDEQGNAIIFQSAEEEEAWNRAQQEPPAAESVRDDDDHTEATLGAETLTVTH